MSEEPQTIFKVGDCYLRLDDISLVYDGRDGLSSEFKTGVTVVIAGVQPICFEGELADRFMTLWHKTLQLLNRVDA